MAKENIKDLSTKILRRRKRIVLVLTITFIVLMAVNLVYIGMTLTNKDDDFQFNYLMPFFLFVAIIVPMNIGVKKINDELAKRNET